MASRVHQAKAGQGDEVSGGKSTGGKPHQQDVNRR